ncbi:MAG: MiaB/RimO family radical SAM methylthiotransferase [Coriobacteriales bacterium]|nr:MiaB/RimO family radical SAM methylthiotransferase [Coriobacteriales bacterium]
MALPWQEEQAVSAPGVAFVSLGCRVNRVETDVIVSELRRAGFELVRERDAAVIVINTCAVTGEAEAKTRKAIRHAAGLPQHPLVIATGCVATLFAGELESLAPNVLVEVAKGAVTRRGRGELQVDGQIPEGSLGFGTVTATGRTRPGIKVQDGCDLRCTYCIVWKARGASRSVAVSEVIRQVREACDQGAREVVLTGINLGRYRCDVDGHRLRLPELLDSILDQTDVGRVRLGSIEPQDVDEHLADVMAASQGRVAPFLHMCLQSGCDETLKRMGRVYDTKLFAHRMELVRERVEHASFGTDLIVGFPGETELEFAQSLAFCERARFSHMHVFRYSKRPGTPAATMENQVDAVVSARRSAAAQDLSQRMRHAEAQALVGSDDLVVVQASGTGITGGLFDAKVDEDIPIDALVPVRIVGIEGSSVLRCEAVRSRAHD